MDNRKKYFQAVIAGVLLIAVSGYGWAAGEDFRDFRMNAARVIAGEGMIRLVASQYAGDGSSVLNERDNIQKLQMQESTDAEIKQGSESGVLQKTERSQTGEIQESGGALSVAKSVAEELTGQSGHSPGQADDTADKISKDRPRAALTFDDGPNAKYTPMLLDGLRERGIHATFFLMGKNIEGKEEIVEQMHKDGHLIGNHTYDHVQLNKLPNDQACQQILKTNNAIYEITGEYPMYLRPPYGAWPKNLELCVTMLPVFWDVDTLDWKSKNVQSVENIVQREVKDGSIILMHDSFKSSVEAALQIADMLTEQGYDLVTADELLVM